MVREERLELSHLAAPEPKSGVSTNSTTPALHLVLHLEKDGSHIARLSPACYSLNPSSTSKVKDGSNGGT